MIQKIVNPVWNRTRREGELLKWPAKVLESASGGYSFSFIVLDVCEPGNLYFGPYFNGFAISGLITLRDAHVQFRSNSNHEGHLG
ncbi:hypothetical protein OIU79_013414 [Salix purpurea]|uniref:Uncharacterized protein n=1 Tax=Salix purpurea TaxID=77065 RepID=A0A9Q0Q5X0_SALPP|nr:hypothetical protein OIU79_013414 [Salix purpurea]